MSSLHGGFPQMAKLSDGGNHLLADTSSGDKVIAWPVAKAGEVLAPTADERYQVEHEIQLICEKERQLLSVDLHDGVCQQLSGIAFMVGSLAPSLGKKGLVNEELQLHELSRLLRVAIEQAKDVARQLHPVDKDGKGLVAALQQLAAKTTTETVVCELDASHVLEMSDNQVALQVYRIIRDAVTYAVMSSRASYVKVELVDDDSHLVFSVTDNGLAISPTEGDKEAMALRMMRHRSVAIGGSIEIASGAEDGNVIKCILPHRAGQAETI